MSVISLDYIIPLPVAQSSIMMEALNMLTRSAHLPQSVGAFSGVAGGVNMRAHARVRMVGVRLRVCGAPW